MGIGKKINLIVTVMIVCLFVSSAISRVELRGIKEEVDVMLNENVEQVRVVDEIRVNIGMQGLYIRSMLLHNTDENKQLLEQYATKLDESIAELQGFDLNEKVAKELEEIIAGNDAFNAAYPTLLAAVNAGDLEKANAILLDEVKIANRKILAAAEVILQVEDEILTESSKSADQKIDSALLISLASSTVTFLVALIVVVFIRKVVVRPLSIIMNNAVRIKDKDFTVEDLKMKTNDEIGQLASVFNEMKFTLKQLIQEIQLNAEHLQASSEELTASTEEITASSEEVTNQVATAANLAVGAAKTATESANSVQKTAVDLESIVHSTTDLLQASSNTSKKAMDGVETISNAKKQMDVIQETTTKVDGLITKLSTQTAEIENISKVISAITDQTNLLALNASIEAARAGDHGKGFAVVADEVKKLANESKSSAELIQKLTADINFETKNVQVAISEALQSVNEGVEVITHAGHSFEQIAEHVQEITSEMNVISSTTNVISKEAKEVSTQMEQIALNSEDTANGLGTISAAMEEQLATLTDVNHVSINVSENASQLQEQTKQFNV